jgi:hypothetical protein
VTQQCKVGRPQSKERNIAATVPPITFGVALAPRGVFDRKLLRLIWLTAVSGAAMMFTAQILKPLDQIASVLVAARRVAHVVPQP